MKIGDILVDDNIIYCHKTNHDYDEEEERRAIEEGWAEYYKTHPHTTSSSNVTNNKGSEAKASVPKPTIGMSKSEVLATVWGEPSRKNISEYSFGTYEQWVYSNYRYVYFEDGIVTAIDYSE